MPISPRIRIMLLTQSLKMVFARLLRQTEIEILQAEDSSYDVGELKYPDEVVLGLITQETSLLNNNLPQRIIPSNLVIRFCRADMPIHNCEGE